MSRILNFFNSKKTTKSTKKKKNTSKVKKVTKRTYLPKERFTLVVNKWSRDCSTRGLELPRELVQIVINYGACELFRHFIHFLNFGYFLGSFLFCCVDKKILLYKSVLEFMMVGMVL